MGDPPSPHPPPSPPRSNLPMLYYGLVVVGTAAIVLALYNLIILKWCSDFTDHRSRQRTGGRGQGAAASWRIRNYVSSFEYKKDGVGGDDDSECAVCLSAFEEGEELRQMPKCKHSFHAPCIDMWLYSHMDCPLCRCPVEPPVVQRRAVVEQSEHSREGLLATGTLDQFPPNA
ncbi:hypothetical protein DH2020_018567 [Rehmannia glutinosa]|uniref:RING-type E3 ubiquitin transferase n=1 Tax=Rehmannia glutinosa TaxID=99300 RepID=A0ABR0WNH9_REHGL